ncbi:MAG: terminase family protein [Pseudomonadota bacterium]
MQKSNAAWLASLPEAERRAFLDSLSENALAAMPWLWELWANPAHQLAPQGGWQVWVIMGGRGAGKTRAGAEWVRTRIEGSTPLARGAARRVALLGETIDQVRDVMVEGESGLLACCPEDRRPEFRRSLNKLVWPNGAEAAIYSAANPEALRGPQFDCAWSDELAKWRLCREAWDMLQFCLRLGDDPRQIVTTTPRDNPVLDEILAHPGTVVTKGGTEANLANLAPNFLEVLRSRYEGTSLGRQELDGEIVRETKGALWSREMIETGRVGESPALDRIVVAVDPQVSAGKGSDECGILVVGLTSGARAGESRAWVLADRTCQPRSVSDWALEAASAYEEFQADRLVAEVNQGGNMVESVIRQIDPNIAFRAVRATEGKRLRAEPVAALYEQGRVHHVGSFAKLEDQMVQFTGRDKAAKSPDRLDALVWAVTDLIVSEAPAWRPGVRQL